MVYISPIAQYLSRYVVLVPTSWETDELVITRTAGVPVRLDEDIINDNLFYEVANTQYQVARIPVADGIHTVESADPQYGVNVLVVGYGAVDSYAYPGGMGIKAINIILE